MIWLAAIFAPLVAAAALVPRRSRDAATRVLVPWSAAPALGVALFAAADSHARFDWLLLGAHFGFGEHGRTLLVLTALLWTAAGWYAAAYTAADPCRVRFMAFFALTMCGNIGLVAAQDIVSFYLGFALMTFCAYGLVVHEADEQAYRAGRIYLVVAVVGEMLLLAALMLLAYELDGLLLADARRAVVVSEAQGLIMALAFGGFGVKAGAVLVHFWLPLAHPVAPVPASAVLSGAMIKAGLLGWLHVLPFGTADLPQWGWGIAAAGAAAAFGAVVAGLAQRDPKTVLAYSSVSQMGLITAVLGIAFVDSSLWPVISSAVMVLALNHALAKGSLFLGVGVLSCAGSRRLRIAVLGVMTAACLAIAAAPWTGGAAAKYLAKEALSGLDGRVSTVLIAILSLSSAATAMLLARFLQLAGRPGSADGMPRIGTVVPWALLALCALLAAPIAGALMGLSRVPLVSGGIDALWPLAAGLAAFAAFARAIEALPIPPGDIVVLLERIARTLRTAVARLSIPGPSQWQINLVHWLEELAATEARRDTSRRLELRLTRWSNAGLAFVAVIVVFVLLLLP